MFVSGAKRKRKIFYTTKGVWIGRKTKSNRKSFLLTVKYEGLKCKIDYTSILPSNHFQREKKKKKKKKKKTQHRERERETAHKREKGQSPELEIDSTAI